MKSLLLKSFKAHTELNIPFAEKSFLLYGDNGAGKSSIYEALKLTFFKIKIKDSIKTTKSTEEDINEEINGFFRKYNNQNLNNDYDVILNDTNINYEDYQVFMLNLEDRKFDNDLKLTEFLDKVYFNIDIDLPTDYKKIRKIVNNILKNFREDIRVVIDKNDFTVKITDKSRNIIKEENLKHYFNEAKLNLVIFAILFAVIELSQNQNKKRILILDDFITSLDMSNRTFLMKYILETFEDFQIVILTHNVYFYNLIMYLVNDIYKVKDNWKYANLYEIGGEHKLYMNDELIELPKLRKEIYGQNPQYNRIGNDLRKKFERLLYEFSKILMIGSVEESNKILELLDKTKNIYLLRDNSINIKTKEQVYKNSNDLLIEIEELIDTNKTIEDVKNRIIEYKEVDNLLPDMLNIIRELKIYQKVSMHSLSHGQVGQNPVSQKEIEKSLELLEVFQKQMQFLVNKKVDGA